MPVKDYDEFVGCKALQPVKDYDESAGCKPCIPLRILRTPCRSTSKTED
jgi:hypothetical protein